MSRLESVVADSFATASNSETSSIVVVNGNRTESSIDDVSSETSWKNDPPVIVGMACHLPGDISSPSDLWQFPVDRKSALGPVPLARYNIDGFYHPQGENRSGSTNVPGGYFINRDIREFDNKFFDPQQRKLLEVSAECLQSSGTTMESVSGSTTGVFVANFTVDYQPGQTRDPDYLHRYTVTGSGATVMSNRISHVFNLNGPSFTVDTACSSFIFALHQALNAMKVGDCDSAIVASANLIMSPELHIGAAKSGVLSPTGTCHTFDVSADGYGRAEAVSALYVKRLSAALRDGNPVRAVIRGSAVNSSGRTPGISLPSGKMQEVVIHKAYRDAGLEFSGTDYVECHGTGTPVGDPIEVDAVGRCFARPKGFPPLLIGSVKTNVGHSEGASGLTSIIKVVKSFEAAKIAPVYGVKKLNPKLTLEERNIKTATELEEWPRALCRASVNSFGYGGANGHVILESTESYLGHGSARSIDAQLNGTHREGPCTAGAVTNATHINGTQTNGFSTISDNSRECLVLPVSAASAGSLKTLIEQILQTVAKSGGDPGLVRNLAYTLTKGRDTLQHRSYLLATWDKDATRYTVSAEEAVMIGDAKQLPFAFVFTGQGSQYAQMAKELLLQSTSFRESIQNLDKVLQTLPAQYRPSWTLEETLLDKPQVSRINEATHSQPICTAVRVGLVDLLRSWNIQPRSVVGHSSGEIAAAYAAGLLDSTQAILVAYFRGYAVSQSRSQGAMMASGLSSEEAKSLIQDRGLQGQVRVACVNAPTSVTLSGSTDAIEALQSHLQSQQKFARKLVTGGRAYHSHIMEEIGVLCEELLTPFFSTNSIAGDKGVIVSSDTEHVRMYSSVGHSPDTLRVMSSRTMSAAYWRQNLEQPVQFSAALANLAADAKKAYIIEIGPHPTLKGPIQQIRKSIGLDEKSLPYASTLVREEDSSLKIKALAGTLFSHGCSLAFGKINTFGDSEKLAEKPKILYQLTPYPWDYTAGLLWSEPRASAEMPNRMHVHHQLLGTIALTGNGIDYNWHNILKPSEMPWIEDHKLEKQVVFPAAGYVAMAIEAVVQVAGIKKQLKDEHDSNLGFELRNVNISAALNVPGENDSASTDLELPTTMSPRRISGANTSVDWHDFSISSFYWRSNQSTVHCAGTIRITPARKQIGESFVTVQSAEGFDLWSSTAKWYKKWHEEGLCFGPQFQSLATLRTDSARKRQEAIATTRITPPLVGGTYEYYPVHPITTDAGLQAACLSGTSGHVAALKTWLPIFIAAAHIQPSLHPESEAEGGIHVKSEEMGFSSRRIDATIRDASGGLVVELIDSRIALCTGKNAVLVAGQSRDIEASSSGDVNPLNLFLQRQPTLRIQWKPDILRLDSNSSSQLSRYLTEFLERQSADVRDDESLAVAGGLLELVGHKNPRMRVLEIGGDSEGYKAKLWQSMLGKQTAFSRVRSWHTVTLSHDGKVSVEDGIEGPFDVVLVPKHATATNHVVITRRSDAAVSGLRESGFDVLDLRNHVLLAVRPVQSMKLQGRKARIIQIREHAINHLRKDAGISDVSIISLSKLDTVEITETDICILLLETEREFLSVMDAKAMNRLRLVTDKTNELLWITRANMLGDDPNPNLTLSNGLSRALMLEQPTLRWSVLDTGKQLADLSNTTNVFEDVVKALVARYDKDDCEFISVDGLLFPQTAKLEKKRLADANPARLTISRPGACCGYLDIEVKAVSLNAKDVYAMSGRVETRNKTTAFDFSGVVTAVGPGSSRLKVGDRVVAYAPFHVGTTARVPAGCVHPLLNNEEFSVVPTLLVAYATALYALNDRAHLRKGKSVLVHAGSGGFGIAAITLARKMGAIVYTTCGSQSKRDYLTKELGVPASHIFSSRDSPFVRGIVEATNGRGVDVIINSLVGDLMHDSWESCLADFGRFVEIGKRELINAGMLNMRAFLHNVTFTAFDLSELFYAEDPFHRAIWDRLLIETLDLYRAGDIVPPPMKVFDITQVAQAYRYFGNKDRVGKVVISMENPQSAVPVAPAPYLSTFDPEKVYLLIGCLGGLGRSLSRWMMTRGARNFVFLGRSGADKPSAKQLVARLEQAGAAVGVIRGDVSQAADVKAAVTHCVSTGRKVGGVVQAAMGLHEALFTNMPNGAWHTGIDPKYQGTWNLHNCLESHELDFFLLTSSVSGTVGTATESNYCSVNGFLDTFARWRRSRGLPCVSVGLGMISEVGYLHENPEIEALLLRKGIQPLNEDEFLQVVDLALASETAGDVKESHMLTGLEPAAVRELSARGFDVTTHGVLVEARSSLLLASLQAEQEAAGAAASQSRDGSTMVTKTAAPWFGDVPATLAASFASVANAGSMREAIMHLSKKRFSNLILMPINEVDESKALPSFGVDSMIASEFRSWFWAVFRVDVPFFDIMSPQKSLRVLAECVEGKVLEGGTK
ncbi:polyketide synthase [Xylaria digitata]|nr:polyketide synthase [Xylaria digitata]